MTRVQVTLWQQSPETEFADTDLPYCSKRQLLLSYSHGIPDQGQWPSPGPARVAQRTGKTQAMVQSSWYTL